jgi:hypothetical protein
VINTNTLTWHEFATLINSRFAAETSFELIDSFRHMEQSASLSAYIDNFEEMMGKLKTQNPMLSDEYFIGCFISGLKDHIKLPLRSRHPTNLVQAYSLARNYEHYNSKKPQSDYSRTTYRSTYQLKPMSQSVKKEESNTKQSTTTRWEKGKCFKCQEPWVPGHNKVCKMRTQLHLIALKEDSQSDTELEEARVEENSQKDEEAPTIQISIHVMSGTATETKTFPLFVTVGSTRLLALNDSGSMVTFMDPSIIIKTGLPVLNHQHVKVTVANGNALWTNVVTPACQYTIQDHQFTTDFRILELEGYYLILGCDWIYEFSHVGLNLRTREFTIEKADQKICFKDETLPNEKFLVSHNKMKRLLHKGAMGAIVYIMKLHLQHPGSVQHPSLHELLDQFKDVFEEPTSLPPQRDVDHTIPLQPGADIVNTRTYRLSHSQKDTLEALILQLLKNQMTRPSMSPYSSPAILVKKKYGT